MKISNLSEKIWYRIIKVIYIIIFLFALCVAGALTYENKPELIINTEKSYLQCDKSKEKNLVYYFNKNSIYSWDIANDGTLSNLDDKNWRMTCFGIKGFISDEEIDAIQKNYSLSIIKELDRSWSRWFTGILLIILSFLIANKLIQFTFFYIICGGEEAKNYIKNSLGKMLKRDRKVTNISV
ncbi:MAG: hypothetical protein ACD_37C00234G0008 [uncultured bacterium]|nr:MAG: hypothetical protein ACD_37C00234G0008 [uncultured bacterium]